ncbi:carbonic anhydrase [Actinoplanes regularis]|uniref:carbonic anhydrase n=1 Tax=Actinoplanes regularis TaxID=52697 RepID=UPI0025531DEB|nr:carbonic anhydrase [Actinoplanes regularis]
MEPGRLFSDPTAAPIPSQRVAWFLDRPDPVEALARLRAGNARFTSGTPDPGDAPRGGADSRPFAVVVGCIDARVPVEAVFGQGVGAICVVRSAGHVLDRAVTGSVEFAVTDLRVSLVVVLGHDDCRAVAAADEAVRTGRRPAGARRFLIDQIAPAIPTAGSADHSLDAATRSHIRRTVATLRQADYLKEALAARRIDVVGGFYRLESGHIEML